MEQSGWSVGIEGGAVKSIIQDRDFSQLHFKGTNPVIGIYVLRSVPKFQHGLRISGISGQLKTSTTPETQVDQLVFNVDYSLLLKIYYSQDKLFKFELGPSLQILYADRSYSGFINRNHAFENVAALALAGKISYSLGDQFPGFSISNHLSLAALSFISNQGTGEKSTGTRGPENLTNLRNFLKYDEFAAIADLVFLRNNLALSKEFGIRHSLILAYAWQYYDMQKGNSVTQAQHQLELSYRYNF